MVWNVLGVIHWLVSFSTMVMAGKALIKFEVNVRPKRAESVLLHSKDDFP